MAATTSQPPSHVPPARPRSAASLPWRPMVLVVLRLCSEEEHIEPRRAPARTGLPARFLCDSFPGRWFIITDEMWESCQIMRSSLAFETGGSLGDSSPRQTRTM